MILALGATGTTGRSAVEHLLRRRERVRVVTRSIDSASTIPELTGAEFVHGDVAVPDSLSGAFEGVDRLYYVPPTMPCWNVAQSKVIELARRFGVRHVARISALGTDEHAQSMSLRFHWQGERELEQSGMHYTHLRGNSFFQNTLFDAPSIRSDDAFYCCVGTLRFAKVDARDIGEVVATVLTTEGHGGEAYTLTGSEALSYSVMAEIMTGVLGRRIRYIDLSVGEWAARLMADGFPRWLADEFAAIYGLGFDDPRVVDTTTDTVERLLGRAPRRFDDFVEEYRTQFE